MAQILSLACALIPGDIAAATTRPAVPELDYLIIVDTSYSMTRLDDQVFQWIYELVASGFEGRMRPDEVYSIWTFNEKVHTRLFSPKVWTPELNRLLAGDSLRFLKMQRFQGQTFLHKVMKELEDQLIQHPNLVVFLVSDGRERVRGTPFDQQITAACVNAAPRLGRVRRPLLLTLVARDGQYVAWSLTLAGNALSVPDLSLLEARKRLAPESELAKALAPGHETKAKEPPASGPRAVPPSPAPAPPAPTVTPVPPETKPAPTSAERTVVPTPLPPPVENKRIETVAVTTAPALPSASPPVVAPAVPVEQKPAPAPVSAEPPKTVTRKAAEPPSAAPIVPVPTPPPSVQTPTPVTVTATETKTTGVGPSTVSTPRNEETTGATAEPSPKTAPAKVTPPPKIDASPAMAQKAEAPAPDKTVPERFSEDKAAGKLASAPQVSQTEAKQPAETRPESAASAMVPAPPVPSPATPIQSTTEPSPEPKSPPPGPNALALPGQTRTGSHAMMVAGLAFLVAAVTLLVLYSRSRRGPRPASLISQSLDRKP